MSHWTSRLDPSGTAPALPRGSAVLDAEAGLVAGAVGDGAVAWSTEVGWRIADRIGQTLPRVGAAPGLLDVLRSSATTTTLRSVRLVAGVAGTGELDETDLTTADQIETVREFARIGVDRSDTLRAIRVGYAVLASALLDGASTLAPDPRTELRRISVLLFEQIDDFTRNAEAAFLQERDLWARSSAARRFELLRRMIDGEVVDASWAQDVLGYRFAGPHLAMIFSAATDHTRSTQHWERQSRAIAAAWGDPGAALTVPSGSRTVWAWVTLRGPAAPGSGPPEPPDPGVTVTVGQPAAGLEGFIAGHRDALAAHRVLQLRDARSDLPCVVPHADVDLLELLLADPAAARRYAARHLGALGVDGPRMTELRGTLARYLDADRSVAEVAAAENISRNTVSYRVNQALEAAGHVRGTPSTALRVALIIRDWLGPA
ncbi:helix-turn-helix domain-containing protein [Tsukamurella spumae]|uniref:PucR family transcriptional regulator n=1 Tax=Tsukamurella spumae TaxID=44753 RepID=A0A846X370_9ACTN|nr:helix-turn-helix domain-containing protein [Tsukamurella spumae]NKY20067.1 PucR family transcriptional regulator [Tsukamurella spumae]